MPIAFNPHPPPSPTHHPTQCLQSTVKEGMISTVYGVFCCEGEDVNLTTSLFQETAVDATPLKLFLNQASLDHMRKCEIAPGCFRPGNASGANRHLLRNKIMKHTPRTLSSGAGKDVKSSSSGGYSPFYLAAAHHFLSKFKCPKVDIDVVPLHSLLQGLYQGLPFDWEKPART